MVRKFIVNFKRLTRFEGKKKNERFTVQSLRCR